MAADSIFVLSSTLHAHVRPCPHTSLPSRLRERRPVLNDAQERLLARPLIAADAGARRWIYSGTLAYGVDAKMGRSSTAGATNSCCRACRGSLPLKPPSCYSCVAGVLAHLLIHARRAGAGLYGGRGAVHAVGGADGACLSDGFAHVRERCAVARAGIRGIGGAGQG